MKIRMIVIVVGFSVTLSVAQASTISFSGVITSASGTGIFSPTPISVGATFEGYVVFDAPVFPGGPVGISAFVSFPGSDSRITGDTSPGGNLLFVQTFGPISNGYVFDGVFGPGLHGNDSDFGF